MKKQIALLAMTFLAVVCGGSSVWAQKMVIGSKVPDFKGVEWLTSMPESGGGKAMLVEFYDPENSSSARFFPKLGNIKQKYGAKITIVVLTGRKGEAIDKVVGEYGRDYSIGYDPDGKVYQSFNVQFLPFTILVSSKGELFWQGNLGNITDDVLNRVK